jgi:hypothetical protein
LCKGAARAAGFNRAEMMATLAGQPLYAASDDAPIERVSAAPVDGVAAPMVRMRKALSNSPSACGSGWVGATSTNDSVTGEREPTPGPPASGSGKNKADNLATHFVKHA